MRIFQHTVYRAGRITLPHPRAILVTPYEAVEWRPEENLLAFYDRDGLAMSTAGLEPGTDQTGAMKVALEVVRSFYEARREES